MKMKKKTAKMLSILLSAVILFTSTDFTVFAKENSESYESSSPFEYALFAADTENGLSMNADSVTVNGQVHTNNDFVYHGNAIDINGSLESANRIEISVSGGDYINLIDEIEENSSIIETEDIFDEIYDEIEENADVHNGYASYSQTIIDKDTIVYGSAGIFSSSFSGDCVFVATNDIQFGVDLLSSVDEGKLFLGSQYGNISIYTSNTQIDGIIYAPNGTVTITGSDVCINGRIIANNILFYGTRLTVNTSESDLDILDCLSGNQTINIEGPTNGKENRKTEFSIEGNKNSDQWEAAGIEWNIYEIIDEEKRLLVKDVDYGLQTAEDGRKAEIVFYKAGEYQVTSMVAYNNKTLSGAFDISIVEDTEPVAAINMEDYFLRNEFGEAEICIEDVSYSMDDDALGTGSYKIFYDENNDGEYQDTEIVYDTETNEKIFIYTTSKVGKYKVVLSVTDEVGIDVADADKIKTAEVEGQFEVGNTPPEIESYIIKSNQIQLLYLYHDSEKETTLGIIEELTKAVEENGATCLVDMVPVEDYENVLANVDINKGNVYVFCDREGVAGYSDFACAKLEANVESLRGKIVYVDNETDNQIYIEEILNYEKNKSMEIKGCVIGGTDIDYIGKYKDYENDPHYSTEYTYRIVNENGEESVWVTDTELSTLADIGVYDISVRVQDNPTGGNSNYTEYCKWSDEYEICKGLRVCHRPVCLYDVSIEENPDDDSTVYLNATELSDNDILFSYKKYAEEAWQDCTLPLALEAEQIYLIRGVVYDEYGNESFPEVKVVDTFLEKDVEITADLYVRPAYEYVLFTDSKNEKNQEYLDILESYSNVFVSENNSYSYVTKKYSDEAFTEYGGSKYQAIDIRASWEEANNICHKLGGHMATIQSREENDELFKYVKEQGYESAYFGLSDWEKEGDWTWSNGEEVTYTNWFRGEPNGNRSENYAMFYYMFTDGGWNDGSFNQGFTANDVSVFICEWDEGDKFVNVDDCLMEDVFTKQGSHKVIFTDIYESDNSEETIAAWEAAMLGTGAEIVKIGSGEDITNKLDENLTEKSDDNEKYYVGDELACDYYSDIQEELTYHYTTEYQTFQGEDKVITVSDRLPELRDSGKYAISVAIEDNNKEIAHINLADELLVYERPKCSVDVTVTKRVSEPEVVFAEVSANSISGEIIGYDCEYKKIGDAEFTNGSLPEKLEPDSYYLLKVTANDINGIESYPVVKLISTYEEDVSDILPPEIRVVLSQNSVVVNSEVTIVFSTRDISEIVEQKLYINDEEVLSDGNIYTFVPQETGDYEIKIVATDAVGNQATAVEILQVREDDSFITDPDSLNVTITELVFEETGVIVVKGNIEAIDEIVTNEITCIAVENNVSVDVNTDNLSEGTLAQIPISGLETGDYNIKVKVSDIEGRVATCSYLFSFDRDDWEENVNDKVIYQYPSEYDLPLDNYKQKAEQLGNWIAAYTYVRNNIRYEPYAGVRKSADEVYDSYGGNAADQAVLLSEMLKTLGYEVRFVDGRIRLSCEQAMHYTGADNVQSAASILQMSDCNATVYSNAGGVAQYVELEHTWLEVYVPGSECGYRSEEYQWVALDTCFKSYTDNETVFDELEEAGLLALEQESMLNAAANDSLEEFIDEWYNKIQEHTFEGESVYLNKRSITKISELKNSDLISFDIVERKKEFAGYSAGDYDYITFELDYVDIGTVSSYELYNSHLFLRYEQLANGYMQAVLSLNGEIIGRGPTVPYGTEETLNMVVHSGHKQSQIRDTVKAGSFYSIVTDAQSITSKELAEAYAHVQTAAETIEGADVYTESYLGSFLDLAGKLYFAQTDISNTLLAEQENVALSRTLSVALLAYDKGNTGDMLYIDVDLDGRIVASRTADLENIKRFSLASGMVSSAYESILWEQLLGVPAVSTVSAIDAALFAGGKMLYLTEANWEDKKGELNVSPEVYSDIESAIASGKMVIVPAEEVSIADWEGSGYVILLPEDYSGTFRITGGLNGGTSAIEVNVAFLANAIVTAVDMYQLVNLVFALSNAIALAGPLAPIVAIGAYVLILSLLIVCIDYYMQSVDLLFEYHSGNEMAGDVLICQTGINVLFSGVSYLGGNVVGRKVTSYAAKAVYNKIGAEACEKLIEILGVSGASRLTKLLRKTGMLDDAITKLVLETSEDGLKKIYSCAAKKMPAEMLMYLCNHTYLLDDYTDDVLRMLADSSYLPGVVYGMLEKYGDDFYRVYQRYGDDAIEVLSKHGDELFGLPESYRHEAIDLVMSYGDEVLEGIRKYGDDFMIRYANEGETFIQEYLEKGDEVFNGSTVPEGGTTPEGGSTSNVVPEYKPYTYEMRKYIISPEDGHQAYLEREYIKIREQGFEDIVTIANNTGISEEELYKLKKHIFLDTHMLSVEGAPLEQLYFQADSEIAYAWKQAMNGELSATEKEWFHQLLNHELTESLYMEQGLPLRDPSTYNVADGIFDIDPIKNAHDKANLTAPQPDIYPGHKLNEEFMKYYNDEIQY